MNIEEFNELIKRIFEIGITKITSVYNYYKHDEFEFKLKKKKFRETLELLKELKSEEEFEIFSNKTFEVSVSPSGRPYFFRDDELSIHDSVNKIKYCLSYPTDEYLLKVIIQLNALGNSSNINYGYYFRRMKNYRFRKEINTDLFEVLKDILRFRTLQIRTENRKTKEEFEILTYAFLFNLSYNTDVSFLPSSIIEGLTRRIRIERIRRSKFEDIEPPKRKYENDLILYYVKGISSESVDLQYLSFYHILEHFFEKIYNDELISSIKSNLTRPSFSYKRNKDLLGLINIIQEKLKYRNDEFQINEPEALKLVIEKFIIDFDPIKNEINTYDPTLLDYYKTKEVSFSNGNKVNFSENYEIISKNLKERIYKTRNSIVHSKETDKDRYLPFKHDRILQKEIVLMRLIAEKIIIESSKEL